MTADVELLPLYAELQGHPKLEIVKHYARANVAHATAAKDAEIEALRAEVRDLLRWNGDAEAMNDGLGRMLRDERARAEQLAEALQLAVRQNSHDMLMTGDELRQCEAALHPTAAQGDEAASA